MTRSELVEHAGYYRDIHKLHAYERALKQLVQPGDVVVDLGAGTGLLGLMAARAGAARVYMIDSGPILGVAQELARRNGFGDVVVPVRGMSSDVSLPEPADVVVCDQIGGFVYDAGILSYSADARRRLLKPDGHLIPGAFTMIMGPVSAPGPRAEIDIWASAPAGLDTGSIHRLAVNTEWRVDAKDVDLRAPGAAVGRLPAWSLERISRELVFDFAESGRVDGLLGWFDAELAPGVSLTNAPDRADRMERWCNFYPIEHCLDVEAGDQLEVLVDVIAASSVVTWTGRWLRGADVLARWRHSTVLGMFLGPEDLVAAANDAPLVLTPAGRAVASALERVDGSRGTQAVIRAVLEEFPGVFSGEGRAREVLGHELGKWARAPR